jgi:hypothetical protein
MTAMTVTVAIRTSCRITSDEQALVPLISLDRCKTRVFLKTLLHYPVAFLETIITLACSILL